MCRKNKLTCQESWETNDVKERSIFGKGFGTLKQLFVYIERQCQNGENNWNERIFWKGQGRIKDSRIF